MIEGESIFSVLKNNSEHEDIVKVEGDRDMTNSIGGDSALLSQKFTHRVSK